MSLPNYYQDPSVLHLNTTPHHAYFIPFAKGQRRISWNGNNLSYLLC